MTVKKKKTRYKMDRIAQLNELIKEEDDSSSEMDSISIISEQNVENSIFIYKEDNPYETVHRDMETNIHQVVGDELIIITRGEGYCCLCREVKDILYIDNSFGDNIPVQLCQPCITEIFHPQRQD